MKGTLIFHTKPQEGLRRATVAAVVDGSRMKFGVSLCSKRDTFRKSRGRIIATGRAERAPNTIEFIPNDVIKSGKYGKFFVEKAIELTEKAQNSDKMPKTSLTGRGLFAKIKSVFTI